MIRYAIFKRLSVICLKSPDTVALQEHTACEYTQHLDIWLSTKVLRRPQVRSRDLAEKRHLTFPASACRAARAAPTAGTTPPAWCKRMVLCGSPWPPSRVCAWCWTWPAWWWSTTSGGTRWGGVCWFKGKLHQFYTSESSGLRLKQGAWSLKDWVYTWWRGSKSSTGSQ